MAATSMCTASRLGSAARLFSRIGDDANARLVRDDRIDYGVDIAGVVDMSDTRTGCTEC